VIRIFFFLFGFGLMVVGFTYVILYMNLFTIEYNFYDDNYYGTSKRRFGELKGKKTAMIIDVNGAKNVKKIYQDAITIFIMPPSLDELRRRLVSRGDNTPEEIERRLDKAKGEIEASSNFDFVVENANLSNAVQEVSHIILNN